MPTPENDATPTEYVVWCAAHRHYLVRASVGGTTWTDDQAQARGYTKPAAGKAADLATWRDHNPVPWAIAKRVIPPDNG